MHVAEEPDGDAGPRLHPLVTSTPTRSVRSAFGPDGSLYVSSGDGSNYGSVDPRAMPRSSSTASPARSCASTRLTGQGLPDNPFFHAGAAERQRPRCGLYGLRNPFRIAVASRDEQGLHRRRRLERLGGDRRREGRELRVALLRGGSSRGRRRELQRRQAVRRTAIQTTAYAAWCSAATRRRTSTRAGPPEQPRRRPWPTTTRTAEPPRTRGAFYPAAPTRGSTATRSSSPTTAGNGSAT